MIRLYGEAVSRARASVKKSMTGNKYEVALDETWDLFGSFMSGAKAGAVCVLSAQRLSNAAHDAIKSSAKALGYGTDACAFVTTEGLEEQALFVLIEGLDPLCLVASDGKTAALLGQAYRCSVPTGDACRLLGRTTVAFLDFESLLETPRDKQIAWALLKKLPKLSGK